MLVLAVLIACCLLLAGFGVRAGAPVLRRLFIPASVMGGLIGLVAVQVIGRAGGAGGEEARGLAADAAAWVVALADEWRAWPGLLISVVFAGLLLERPQERAGSGGVAERGGDGARLMRGATLAALYVWVIVVGEIVIGLALAWVFILPAYDVPPAFGQLLETGFAGGHGTAAAMGEVFAGPLEFAAGRDLGFFVATFGLVWSVVSGIALVNVGVRRGWTRAAVSEVDLAAGEGRFEPVTMARARVSSDVLDPLALQLCFVGLAFLVGMGLRWVFVAGAGQVVSRAGADAQVMDYVGNVPLFLFTLLGGWLVRRALRAARADHLIDTGSVKRIVGVSIEFLIVAALASLRIEVVSAYLWPLLLLCAAGCAWAIVCVTVIAPRVLPRDRWFELGLINYGMSTGTTAQGMMLLRLVDRDLESGAAEDYAVAAPFSAPFIGGGVITLSLPLIAANAGVPVVVGIGAVVVATACGLGVWLRRAWGGGEVESGKAAEQQSSE